MSRKRKIFRAAPIPRREFPPESDGWIWEQYSLFLIINRHVADFFDDDTVSQHLRSVRNRIPLPFYDD
jgi:hypothetical protein